MLFVFYACRSLVAQARTNTITILAVCLLVAGGSLGLTFYLGLKHLMVDTAPPQDIIVLAKGASEEVESRIDRDTVDRLAVREGLARENNQPLIARELVTQVQLDPPHPGDYDEPVTVRGIDDRSMQIHHATIAQGTLPQPNSLDVILGRRVADRHPNLPIGSEIPLLAGQCRVAGIFTADGGPFEDEMWTSKSALALHLKDNAVHSMTLVSADRAAVPGLVSSINESKDLQARAEPLSVYRAKGAGLSTIAWIVFAVLVVLLVLGTAAIATTMNASVDMRIPELGAIAAIGVRRRVLGNIVLLEALVLGAIGGVLGVVLCTVGGRALGSLSVGATPVSLSPSGFVVAVGVCIGLFVGLIGGVISSVPVRRLDILQSMR